MPGVNLVGDCTPSRDIAAISSVAVSLTITSDTPGECTGSASKTWTASGSTRVSAAAYNNGNPIDTPRHDKFVQFAGGCEPCFLSDSTFGLQHSDQSDPVGLDEETSPDGTGSATDLTTDLFLAVRVSVDGDPCRYRIEVTCNPRLFYDEGEDDNYGFCYTIGDVSASIEDLGPDEVFDTHIFEVNEVGLFGAVVTTFHFTVVIS